MKTTDVAHLTYLDIHDQNLAYELIKLDVPEGGGTVTIDLFDGTIRMGLRHAILHLFFWNIYLSMDRPVTKDKIFEPKAINNTEMTAVLTQILNDIRQEVSLVENHEQFSDVFCRCINEIYNFVTSELNAYIGTLDIISILKLLSHPKIKEARAFKYNEVLGTNVVEKQIANAGAKVLELLGDENEIPIKDNCLYWSVKTKQINPLQLTQMMVAYGPRTDIDDAIVRYPILNNAIEGLKDIWDISVESLATKKSAIYNKMSVPESQYLNRKQQLLCSIITTIYPDDCGNRITYPFKLNRESGISILGMNAIDEDGEIIKLTQEVIDALPVGEYVNIINPATCRHQDGVCYHCGGDILKNINPKMNLGMHFASLAIRVFTQRILSNKHHNKTSTIEYRVPVESSEYFEHVTAQKVEWHSAIKPNVQYMSMGISSSDIDEIRDIEVANFLKDPRYQMTDEEQVAYDEALAKSGKKHVSKFISEEKFTSIKSVKIRDNRNGNEVTLPLSHDGLDPFLTFEMLLHTQKYLKRMKGTHFDENNYLWIPMKGTENIPIFSSLVLNDSIRKFVYNIKRFMEKTIGEMTSLNAAITAFKELVHSKEKTVHMTILCTMLKAYLVTDEHNYSIPIVTDPENVIFKAAPDLISRRTVSTELAYERLFNYLKFPDTYLYPKGKSILDPFFGI